MKLAFSFHCLWDSVLTERSTTDVLRNQPRSKLWTGGINPASQANATPWGPLKCEQLTFPGLPNPSESLQQNKFQARGWPKRPVFLSPYSDLREC